MFRQLIYISLLTFSLIGFAKDAQIVRFELTSSLKAYLKQQDYDVTGVNLRAHEIEALLTSLELGKVLATGAKVKFSFPENLLMAPDEAYKNPDEIEEFVKDIHQRYPDITELKIAGTSLEGRNIWAIKISDNPTIDEQEPVMLVNGMHHAREVMTPEITTDMIEYLASQYGHDAKVTNWVNNAEIWILPMLNVDGNNMMWTEDSMWRKNTRGGYGVDINRNYPTGWNSCNGSSSNQSAQDFRGPAPASEPETQVMMKLVQDIKPVFNISYHSYSELVIYPFGCKPLKTPAEVAVESIGRELAKSIDYSPGTAWELLYNADGGDLDWMYTEQQVIPYVIEVNSNFAGFHPRYDKWRDKTVERNRQGWMYLLNRLEGPSLQGSVSLNDYTHIKVFTPNSSKSFQTYKINPDGSYYIILKPGKYDFTFEGMKTKRLNGIELQKKVVIND